MKINYHKDTDSLYMHLKETPTLESEEVAPGTVLHFDEDGSVTGFEIYYGASDKSGPVRLRDRWARRANT